VTDYIVRKIDADLWKQVKDRAALEGRALRFVILALLAEYVKHGLRGNK
jgi:hypothetical protein